MEYSIEGTVYHETSGDHWKRHLCDGGGLRGNADWTQAFNFPASCLLSLQETMKALHRTGDLIVWDVESLGPDYAETLRRWKQNLADRQDEVRALGMEDRFFRIWNYYFPFCEIGFESRYINDMQLVISRPMNRTLGTRNRPAP